MIAGYRHGPHRTLVSPGAAISTRNGVQLIRRSRHFSTYEAAKQPGRRVTLVRWHAMTLPALSHLMAPIPRAAHSIATQFSLSLVVQSWHQRTSSRLSNGKTLFVARQQQLDQVMT